MRQGWRVIFHSHTVTQTHTHSLLDTLPVTLMRQSAQLPANVARTLRGIFSPLLLSQHSHCPHTRLLPRNPRNKPRDDINRWTVVVLMHKSQQEGSIKFSDTKSNMTWNNNCSGTHYQDVVLFGLKQPVQVLCSKASQPPDVLPVIFPQQHPPKNIFPAASPTSNIAPGNLCQCTILLSDFPILKP